MATPGTGCRQMWSEAPALASVQSNLPGGLASYIKVKPIGQSVGIFKTRPISPPIRSIAAEDHSQQHPTQRGGAIIEPNFACPQCGDSVPSVLTVTGSSKMAGHFTC